MSICVWLYMFYVYTVEHPAWKKGSVAEGQLLISFFSIKPHFLYRLQID